MTLIVKVAVFPSKLWRPSTLVLDVVVPSQNFAHKAFCTTGPKASSNFFPLTHTSSYLKHNLA